MTSNSSSSRDQLVVVSESAVGDPIEKTDAVFGDTKSAVGDYRADSKSIVDDPLKKIVGSEALASAQEVVAKARNLANKLAKEADSQARARQNQLANLDIGLMYSPSLGTIQLTRNLR